MTAFQRKILAEKEGFEPSYRLPDKLISSQPRYGHFGTSPCRKICKFLYDYSACNLPHLADRLALLRLLWCFVIL